jgi:hypothetical protein
LWAFQDEGWPPKLEVNPLGEEPLAARQLGNVARELTRKLKGRGLRFRANRRGQIRWERVQE